MKHQELTNWCLKHSLPDLIQSSKIQPVPAWGKDVWIKREDESGFLGGSKRRKYASLLQMAKIHGIEKLRIIGGANSNHVPALMSLAKQHGFACELWLKASNQLRPKGTAWITMILNGDIPIRWLDADEWEQVDTLAQTDIGERSLAVPEGACCLAAWPGALSLAADIVQHEEEGAGAFEHIWIDSGTGLTAAALITGMALLGRFPHVHVMLAAGNEQAFFRHLNLQLDWARAFPELDDLALRKDSMSVQVHMPVSAKAFGSVNATVRQAAMRIATETGILVDPIYTAKLVMTMLDCKEKNALADKTLLVHGGGLASLLGYTNTWDISWQ